MRSMLGPLPAVPPVPLAPCTAACEAGSTTVPPPPPPPYCLKLGLLVLLWAEVVSMHCQLLLLLLLKVSGVKVHAGLPLLLLTRLEVEPRCIGRAVQSLPGVLV
jgi:hypothetical protein